MSDWKWPSLFTLFLLGVPAQLALAPPVSGQEPSGQERSPDEKPLPGYYRFYEKQGDMVRIPAEVARDQRIDEGRLRIRNYERPLPDFELPDASGQPLDLESLKGKNLVLTPFRTWW